MGSNHKEGLRDPMQYTETVLTADDSTELFVRHYLPATNKTSQTVMIVHGTSEHGRRYDHVARMFVEHGWNVIVPDSRGHGRSGGVPTHIRDFHHYILDLEIIQEHFHSSPRQTVMLGHSLGGLVALRYAQTFPNRLTALILLSPLLKVKVPIPLTTLALGKALSFVAPRTRFRSRVNSADTTRTQEAVAQRLKDPLIHRSVTAGWFFAMKSAMAAAWAEADRLKLPLLVMQAGQDRIVDPTVPEPWLKSAGSSDKTFRFFPEHFHELLNEPDWQDTADSILKWLQARIPQTQQVQHG